jgi:hypothetical protein
VLKIFQISSRENGTQATRWVFVCKQSESCGWHYVFLFQSTK